MDDNMRRRFINLFSILVNETSDLVVVLNYRSGNGSLCLVVVI